MDPILAAIKWADRPEHDGAAYTLRVGTTACAAYVVDVFKVDGMPYLLRRRQPDTAYDREEMFFNPANVESVTVLW